MTHATSNLAVVTGGAGAIGAATCERLASAGQRVVVADLNLADATATANALPGAGHIGIQLDVAETDVVAEQLSGIASEHGTISTLINVAGWDRFVPFVDTTPDFWDRVIDINYRGTLNTVHAVLPGMIDDGYGRIVSVASDAARVGSSLESWPKRWARANDLWRRSLERFRCDGWRLPTTSPQRLRFWRLKRLDLSLDRRCLSAVASRWCSRRRTRAENLTLTDQREDLSR